MKEPCDLTAVEAISRIVQGKLTRAALVASCAERIKMREPQVQAWQYLDIEAALDLARALDKSPRNDVLQGIPFGAKDIIETAGMPTEYGSRIYSGNRTTWDAACVAITREAGGILFGKTVTTEFAHRPGGKTRNPWDSARTPGGSSSGSAAAVAAGMVPVAYGTQTGGSTIRPAAFCGVVGYKPTFGDFPLFGVREHARSFDTLSLIARSVEDVELFRAVLLKERNEPAPAADGATLRIGFCRTPYWDQAEESTQRMLEDAASKLAAAGAKVSEAELPPIFPRFANAARDVGGFEFVQQLAFELTRHRDQLSKALLAGRVKDGLACDFQQYAESRIVMEECRRSMAEVFERHDVLLTPSAPGEAPEGHESTGNAIFNCLWTELHLPALTIPASKGPSGLPLGPQLIGKWSDDRRLIAAAKWIAARLA